MPDELFRKLIVEPADLKAFRKAVREYAAPLWKTRHPQPRKKTGPRKLTLVDVHAAVERVLDNLKPASFESIEWKEFLPQVQVALGNSPNKAERVRERLYHESVLRPLILEYMCGILYWDEIPPKLFARRLPWMPRDRFDLAARRRAFYQYKATLLPQGLREDALAHAKN